MSETWASLIPLVLIVAVFWLLVLRPARRSRQAVSELQSSLEVGREVMTTSGIYGVVVGLDDTEVRLRIADGVEIRMHRQAIGQLVEEPATGASGDTGPDTP